MKQAKLPRMAFVVSHTDYADDDGAWGFTVGLPEPALAPYVLQFFEVKVRGVLAQTRERVMPMGDITVMVNLGPVQQHIDRDDHSRITEFPDAFISGIHGRHLITGSPFGSWLCGVKLTPRGAFRFFGEAPAALADRVVTWADVFGPNAAGRIDQLRSAPTPPARFALFAAALRARFCDGPDWDGAVVWAVDTLAATSGGVPVAALAAEIGWSRQKLHQRFTDAVGLSPKAYARVLRFRETIVSIGQLERPDLAAIAHGAGYYDQAHFNHDFRDITGLTPTEFLRRRTGGDDLGFAKL